jgi:hypothetical protein
LQKYINKPQNASFIVFLRSSEKVHFVLARLAQLRMFRRRTGGLMKKNQFSIGIMIPITLIALTLIALILMNQVHAEVGF